MSRPEENPTQANSPEAETASVDQDDKVPVEAHDPNDLGFRLLDNHTRGDRRRVARARALFSTVLAADLNQRGAASVDELYYRLSLFELPMSRIEIRQLAESGRRLGLIKPSGYKQDLYGNPTVSEDRPDIDEWTTTKAGQKLQRPRALTLADLTYKAAGERDRVSKLFDTTKSSAGLLIPAAISLIGAKVLADGKVAAWATAVAVLVVLLWLLAQGMKGELELRAAAQSWPRFKAERSHRYHYQMNWARSLFTPTAILILYLTAASALVGLTGLKLALGLVLAELLLAFLLYRFWIRRLRERWKDDQHEWRQTWTSRQITPPRRVSS